MNEKYVLRMENIGKEYFGNNVLKGVNLKIKPGEIHALLGENGAGKSTLMNILFGMPVIHSTGGFKGEVYLNEEKINIKSPKDAMKLGIGMVHQEFMLIPGFTITENIKLNREITKSNIISKVFGKRLRTLDIDTMNVHANKALKTTGIDIDERTIVGGLPVGYMQFVEIAREIDKENVKLMVFDEPTAVLTESEAETLMKAMKKIAESGIAIIFITHRLDEVIKTADNITILRDGELVASREVSKTNVVELAELMVGRKLDISSKEFKNHENDETIISIKDLKVEMPGERVKDVDLGGLAGQGKIGIANGIMGLYPSMGKIQYKSEELPLNDTEKALKSRLAFVSEDRRGVGLLLDDSIETNIVVTSMQINNNYFHKIGPMKIMNSGEVREHALKMIKDLDIRCTGPTQPTRRLSGGNQQKVCIARALTLNPEVIFVSEPTRGIDIGAKKLVLDLLVKLNKEEGMTVVITSSELNELRSICDRIAIVTEGKISGILKPNASDAEFGLVMSGLNSNLKEGGE